MCRLYSAQSRAKIESRTCVLRFRYERVDASKCVRRLLTRTFGVDIERALAARRALPLAARTLRQGHKHVGRRFKARCTDHGLHSRRTRSAGAQLSSSALFRYCRLYGYRPIRFHAQTDKSRLGYGLSAISLPTGRPRSSKLERTTTAPGQKVQPRVAHNKSGPAEVNFAVGPRQTSDHHTHLLTALYL